MQQRIQVLGSETKSGTSKKSGAAYSMVVCQVNVFTPPALGQPLAGEKVEAGELILPKGHPEVKAGQYVATFKLAKTGDGKVGAVVEALTPASEAVARKVA
jgi:hypothetical protein